MEFSATPFRANLTAGKPIGILGASSVVAEDLTKLLPAEYQPILFSRRNAEGKNTAVAADVSVPCWISVIPIWAIPNYFSLLLARKARRIIAVSSTSRFTKIDSPIKSERLVAAQLSEGERAFQAMGACAWRRVFDPASDCNLRAGAPA